MVNCGVTVDRINHEKFSNLRIQKRKAFEAIKRRVMRSAC